MIPTSTLISMAVAALLGFAVPVALAWWLVRKYQIRWQTILIGAGTFIVFALVLEPILHQVVLKGPYGTQLMSNVWYYALYGGLAAGLFEETGRFLSMKFLMKKISTLQNIMLQKNLTWIKLITKRNVFFTRGKMVLQSIKSVII